MFGGPWLSHYFLSSSRQRHKRGPNVLNFVLIMPQKRFLVQKLKRTGRECGKNITLRRILSHHQLQRNQDVNTIPTISKHLNIISTTLTAKGLQTFRFRLKKKELLEKSKCPPHFVVSWFTFVNVGSVVVDH